MICKGHIFEIAPPFGDPDGSKTRPALALSEPDECGDIEMLFINAKSTLSGNSMELVVDDFDGAPLPFRSFLHPDKKYLLHRSVIVKELTGVKGSFLEKVLREQTLIAARKHYEVRHKSSTPFRPGGRIPYGGRVFDEEEVAALVDASLDFWLTSGPYAERFERCFADFIGVSHCSLVNSGSSANLLAFMALTSPSLGASRIRRGDEVITVAAAFPTTVAPIIQFGAEPVFVDVQLPSCNIDCSQLEEALSDKTRAVMLAHTLGNPFNLEKVKSFCESHNLWLIEDNCDSLGSKYYYRGLWRHTGTFGHLATSSFYPPHHMTMGEGGAVYTNDAALKRVVDSLRDWGRDCWCPSGRDNTCGNRFGRKFGELPCGYDHKYVYSHFGYNLKATDLQAAIGCVQLEKLTGFIEARKRNWKLMRDGLSDCAEMLLLPEPAPNSDPSWFGFLITVREEAAFPRDRLVAHLEGKGIQTRMLFAGNLIKHPCFDEMRGNGRGYRVVSNLENTDRILRDTFWLGVYPGMREGMLEFMVDTIRSFLLRG